MKIWPEFITESYEKSLRLYIEVALEKIPQRKSHLRNRILRFGWDYEKPNKWVGDIPHWSVLPVMNEEFFPPTNITVNEYLRGQRIAPHIDSPKFGDIAILSLLADVTMRFTSPVGEKRDFVLPRRSLAVMSGELRQTWTHETLPLADPLRYSVIYRRRIS